MAVDLNYTRTRRGLDTITLQPLLGGLKVLAVLGTTGMWVTLTIQKLHLGV